MGMAASAALADTNVATQTLQIVIQPALLVSLGPPGDAPPSLSFALDVPASDATQQTLTVPLTYRRFAGGPTGPEVSVSLDTPLPEHLGLLVGSASVLKAGRDVPLGGTEVALAVVAEAGATAGAISRTVTVTVSE